MQYIHVWLDTSQYLWFGIFPHANVQVELENVCLIWWKHMSTLNHQAGYRVFVLLGQKLTCSKEIIISYEYK